MLFDYHYYYTCAIINLAIIIILGRIHVANSRRKIFTETQKVLVLKILEVHYVCFVGFPSDGCGFICSTSNTLNNYFSFMKTFFSN